MRILTSRSLRSWKHTKFGGSCQFKISSVRVNLSLPVGLLVMCLQTCKLKECKDQKLKGKFSDLVLKYFGSFNR